MTVEAGGDCRGTALIEAVTRQPLNGLGESVRPDPGPTEHAVPGLRVEFRKVVYNNAIESINRRLRKIVLPGERMRPPSDLPTSDAGHPQEAPIAVNDVICLDDIENVMRYLLLHSPGPPPTVVRAGFRQLVRNEDQLC